MKRILHIIPTLDYSGAGRQMALLASGLAYQYRMHVCALKHGGLLADELAKAQVPLTVIEQRCALDPNAMCQLRTLAIDLKPDVIHSWHPSVHIAGAALSRLLGGAPLVLSQHCGLRQMSFLGRMASRQAAHLSQSITVTSQSVRASCAADGWPEEKIRVISNGVAPRVPCELSRGQMLAELGLPEDSRLVGVVGALRQEKRLKDAIWAADLLKVIRDDVHLLLIGQGDHFDRLFRFRDQVEIRDKVHFLGWRSDVPRLMPHFDVFWSTGGCDGPSAAILEAMAAGVPIVAADLPATRDLIDHGEHGFLVPLGRRAEFAKYTHRILDDHNLARRLGDAAARRAAEEFGRNRILAQYAAIYAETATPALLTPQGKLFC